MNRFRTGPILAASALVPALLLSIGGAALAATDTLTLTVLNRAGAKVALSATVVDVNGTVHYTIKTGRAKRLPRGTYDVLAQITTGDTTTLAGLPVKVSGATKLTVDARKGKRVGLALSPGLDPNGPNFQIAARVCAPPGISNSVEADGGQVYVLPTTEKSIGFAALGSWTDLSGTTDSYAVLNQTTGVPANPTRTYRRSALGTVTVDSRRGPTGADFSDVAVQPIGHGCGDQLYTELVNSEVPTTSKLHLSPTRWDIRSDEFANAKNSGATYDIGGYLIPRNVAAGKSYNVRFYGAAWGPGAVLPSLSRGTISYDLNDGFEDPAYPGTGSVEGGDKATATLVFNGKTIKTKKDTGWMSGETVLSYAVKKSGWYTLRNVASRYYPEITYPAGMLSTASVATYRFPAQPDSTMLVPVYAVQLIPGGLDQDDRAKPGSTTNVALKLTRQSWSDLKPGKNPAIKSVTANMSADGGKTWKRVPVQKIGSGWAAVVGNPSGGAVSLQVRVTNTSGAYSEVTIYRAYGIG